MDHLPGEVTQLLTELEERKEEVMPRLFELLYNQLRGMARRRLQSESPEHTLQPTALVHEAYLRLVGTNEHWRNRAHFFAIASSAMRRILVDHARAKHAAKRPSSRQKIDLEDAPMFAEEHFDGIIALDQALEKLSLLDDRQSRIVELRYFGGLTTEEAADALGVTAITVHRDWRVAKAWLRRELSSQESAAT